MKKLVFASAMALASMSLVSIASTARPGRRPDHHPGSRRVQFLSERHHPDRPDPKGCRARRVSLQTYPQSVVKKAVLDQLIDCYNQTNQPAKVIDAASRLLQVDPNNMKAIFASVYWKKQQCASTLDASGVATDPQTCDDAAVLAQKGLTAPKPAAMADADWSKLTSAAYPAFHSAIAFDDAVSKKDFGGAIKEYTAELMLYPPDACTTAGPVPCRYAATGAGLCQARRLKGRNQGRLVLRPRMGLRAAELTRAQIEPQLEYWYKRYHGTLDGDAAIKQQIAAIETQAQATLFPPGGFTIAPAPTPADLAHHAYTSGDPKALSLEDKEYILANGSDADATGLWALLKGQPTPVPGIVISDPANALKISVTTTASVKPKDFVVKLTNPVACSAVPAPPSELKIADAQAYILANGVKADTDAMGDALTDTPRTSTRSPSNPGS